MAGLGVGFSIANANGVTVSDLGVVPERDGEPIPLEPGERVKVRAEIENLLAAGRYFVHLGVNRAAAAGVALYVNSAVDFAVFGGTDGGIVSLPHEIAASVAADGHQGSTR
jgi:Wzt C-terminal domain